MSKHATFDEGRPPRRPSRARQVDLWQEVALGLGIAATGIVLALSVVHAGSPHTERLPHPSAYARTLQLDAGPAVIRPFSPPKL